MECLFSRLPRDCKLIIFSFLDRQGLASAVVVCWEWRRLINDNQYIFKIMCKRLWDVKVPDEKVKDWKAAFREIVSRDQRAVSNAEDWPAVERCASLAVHDSMLRTDFIYNKGIEKFKCSPLLGNYANFHWNYTKLFNLAEKFYQQAIEVDKNNVWPICNYATFLWDVRHKLDEAEKHYERALATDSSHLDTLLNYADFLNEVRDQNDRAEQLYLTGLEHHPDSAKLLGHYALFLLNKRKDPLAAGKLYQRAAEMQPQNAEALGNYGWFLSSEYSKNFDEAEKYYLKAIEVNPHYVHAIYNYAMFLQDDRRDLQKAKKYYERALEIQGSNTRILQSYSSLLAQLNSLDEADKSYLKALKSEPTNVDLLRSYAHYLSAYRKDHLKAEQVNLQTLKMQPNDPYVLLNYASCLLLQEGKEKQGLDALLQALDNRAVKQLTFIRTVAWIILFLHCPNEEVQWKALEQVKKCLVWEKARLPLGCSCNLDCNIHKAMRTNHPDKDHLQSILQVFVGEEDVSTLDTWKKWADIKLVPSSPFTVRRQIHKSLTNTISQ
jgi:tetratricopeptide (TPR) repeat protein